MSSYLYFRRNYVSNLVQLTLSISYYSRSIVNELTRQADILQFRRKKLVSQQESPSKWMFHNSIGQHISLLLCNKYFKTYQHINIKVGSPPRNTCIDVILHIWICIIRNATCIILRKKKRSQMQAMLTMLTAYQIKKN